MNKILKKTLSIIFTILMIVTTVPFAFAADCVHDNSGEHFCLGYYCGNCDSYYGELNPNGHYWFGEQCGICYETHEHTGNAGTICMGTLCELCYYPYGEVTAPDAHDWNKYDCTCGYCGAECEHPSYTDGLCDDCGFVCLHEDYTNGTCDICGYICPHESYTDSVCDTCDCVCPHDWSNKDGICANRCGETCDHPAESIVWTEILAPTCEPGIENGVCSLCNYKGLQEVLCDSSTYPESEHFHSANASDTLAFSYPGAEKLILEFSELTDAAEISIFSGAYGYTYTGYELAGKTIEIDSHYFDISVTSKSSCYGFSFESITAIAPAGDFVREIPALGHDWSNKDGVCARGCGETCKHDNVTGATCITPVVCDECSSPVYDYTKHEGEYETFDYDSTQHVSQYNCCFLEPVYADHEYKDYKVSVPATCHTNAWETGYCECGQPDEREVPNSNLNHEPLKAVIENEVAAECDVEGSYDSVVYCDLCGDELSRETITVDALGHEEGETVVEDEVAPECGVEGSYDNVVYCDVCGEELDRDTVAVDALTHTDADGDYLCDNGCGHEFEKPVTPEEPTPDTPDEPTDEEDTCEDCGKVHNGFFSEIICFFTRIINFIKNLFA